MQANVANLDWSDCDRRSKKLPGSDMTLHVFELDFAMAHADSSAWLRTRFACSHFPWRTQKGGERGEGSEQGGGEGGTPCHPLINERAPRFAGEEWEDGRGEERASERGGERRLRTVIRREELEL